MFKWPSNVLAAKGRRQPQATVEGTQGALTSYRDISQGNIFPKRPKESVHQTYSAYPDIMIYFLFLPFHLSCLLQSWTGPEKLLALDELIDSCEPTQVKHMMQVIEPQFQRDFISLLPKEVSSQAISSVSDLLFSPPSQAPLFLFIPLVFWPEVMWESFLVVSE